MRYLHEQTAHPCVIMQKPSEELAAATDQHVSGAHRSGEQSSSDLRPAHWQQAVAAHYVVMDAQAAAAKQQWNRADEQLTKVRQANCVRCTIKVLLKSIEAKFSHFWSFNPNPHQDSPEQPGNWV